MRVSYFLVLISFIVGFGLSGCARQSTPMDADRFWNVIEQTTGAGGERVHERRLFRQLRALSDEEIQDFARHYNLLQNRAGKGDLWAAGLLLNHGHGTDDGFAYFRHWLIAQGRVVYETALLNPDSLANVVVEIDDGPTAAWESYGATAADVYRRRNGRDIYQDLKKSGWIDAASDAERFDAAVYSDEVLAQKFPRLWNRYGRFKQAFDRRAAQPR